MTCYYEVPFTVNSHDCDRSNLLKPSGYLRYLQENANLHIEHAGFGWEALAARGCAFIIARAALDVYEPVRAYERIVCRTAPAPSSGVTFNRSAEMLKDGRVCARLITIWALVQFPARTLIRVSSAGMDLPTAPMPELNAPLILRIPRPTVFEDAGDYTVRYSVCDRNRHMNNTRYPDMFCDAAEPPENKLLRTMSISYLTEAPLGETLRLQCASAPAPDIPEGEIRYFKAIRRSDGKLCCEAIFTFGGI